MLLRSPVCGAMMMFAVFFFYILFIPLHIYAIALRWISEWWYTRHSGRQRQNSPKETTIRVYILFTRWVLATLHMDNLGVAYSFIYQCISQIVLSSNFFSTFFRTKKSRTKIMLHARKQSSSMVRVIAILETPWCRQLVFLLLENCLFIMVL